ncbi:MAG: hypothetical protein U0930_01875 [Pirellulales bacterium]
MKRTCLLKSLKKIGTGAKLAKWVNTRYGTNYNVNDLKKIASPINEKKSWPEANRAAFSSESA